VHSKFFVSFRKIVLIFSFIFIFTENAVCQIGLSENFVSLKSAFGEDDKTVNPSRPRIYNEIEKSHETVTKKAVTDFNLERKAFEQINQQRAAVGLQPLVWSDDATKIARIHSENMANLKFFSHKGSDGLLVNERADSVGINKWRAIGENIAFNQGYKNPIEFAVECWMKSNGHRENILNGRWKESGIGIAVTADGAHYFTQVFLERK
jgi:uncharacterized protein YkwD